MAAKGIQPPEKRTGKTRYQFSRNGFKRSLNSVRKLIKFGRKRRSAAQTRFDLARLATTKAEVTDDTWANKPDRYLYNLLTSKAPPKLVSQFGGEEISAMVDQACSLTDIISDAMVRLMVETLSSQENTIAVAYQQCKDGDVAQLVPVHDLRRFCHFFPTASSVTMKVCLA